MDDSVITSTQTDMPSVCKGCSKLQSRLERALRQLERQLSFGEEVRVENEKLKQQLQDLKQKKQAKHSQNATSSSTQTDAVASYHPHPVYRNGLSSGSLETAEGDPELEAAATGVGESKERSVADMLRDTANECLNHTGYVYDEKTGLYYDYGSGYYYDPHRKLFYEPRSGTYYSYDEDTREYHFHSRENPEHLKRHCEQLWIQTGGQHAPPKRKTKRKNEKQPISVDLQMQSPFRDDGVENGDDDIEEGEISSDVDEAHFDANADELEEMEGAIGGEMEVVEEIEEFLFDSVPEYPPCVRLMVTTSGNINVGTLFIITCAGGTIGRKTNRFQHAVALNDEALPECACQIDYDSNTGTYLLIARAKGGRVALNGQLKKKKDGATRILHGDKLSVGGTVMGVHIHPGSETCDGCEPGVAQAAVYERSETEVVTSSTSKEDQRRQQMKQLKSKFGLRGAAFENPRVKGRDRAAERRIEKGSDTAATSGGGDRGTSAHQHLPDSNKGAQLLAKMGWKPGQSLGKTGSDGIVEPVTAEIRLDPQAGFGSDLPSVSLDAGSNLGQMSRIKNWKKMKERYEQLEKVSSYPGHDPGT